jgi:hypothetical protein
MKPLKKYLIYWDYRRSDLLLPFHKLSDQFEWSFIFFRNKQEDNTELSYPRLYWGDFTTPYELLKEVKPDGIIFSDLSSLYAVGLNIAAKNKTIPTYLLDHGIKVDYDYYLSLEGKTQVMNPSLQTNHNAPTNFTQSGKMHTLRFYFSALQFKNGWMAFKALQLFYSVFRLKSEGAFAKVQFALRCPDKYLLFSKQNFGYYHRRDGIDASKIIYFGNPHQDEYMVQLDEACIDPNNPYYLLLDDGQIEGFGITPAQKNDFICKLNEFALSQRSPLVVKLHPFDYGRTDLYQHENIVYKTSADISALITGAKGCFAISTTLMLPLIISGKLIAFKVQNSKLQEVIESYGVEFLDYINFSPIEIDFTKGILYDHQLATFIEHFLFKKDGNATERLKQILLV